MAHYVKREWRVFMEDTLEREVNVRYERDNSINYAVIDAQKEWNCEDDYEVKMLMFNMQLMEEIVYIMIFLQNSSLVSCLNMGRLQWKRLR